VDEIDTMASAGSTSTGVFKVNTEKITFFHPPPQKKKKKKKN
jgi:hypothetical protein